MPGRGAMNARRAPKAGATPGRRPRSLRAGPEIGERARDPAGGATAIRERRAMIASMEPTPAPGEVVFCSTRDPGIGSAAMPSARGFFAEAEGMSLILPVADAAALGFDTSQRMRQITLAVHSALDGVGLTEAVASALAGEGIPCNIVAAFHHDHVFVPSPMAERAVAVLRAAQRAAAEE